MPAVSTAPLHDDELALDLEALRRELGRVRPGLAALVDEALVPLAASGSSNRLLRLGHDLLVRVPRQVGGATALRVEARWGRVLGALLPVEVPQVLVVGEPTTDLPAGWSLTRWIEGERPVAGTGAVTGEDLAALVAALRRTPVPAEAVADPALRGYRSGPLSVLADDGRELLEECRGLPDEITRGLDLGALADVWERAVAADRAAAPAEPSWVHSDLVAENLLVRGGRLAALLDLGDVAVGDPTVDLIGAWELCDAGGRRAFRDALGVDDATWLRGAGWSVLLLVMTLSYYGTSMPARCADRVVAARAVLEELG